MVAKPTWLDWRIPLILLACVSASLVTVWAVSRILGFDMNPSLVAVLGAALSAAAIAVERRRR